MFWGEKAGKFLIQVSLSLVSFGFSRWKVLEHRPLKHTFSFLVLAFDFGVQRGGYYFFGLGFFLSFLSNFVTSCLQLQSRVSSTDAGIPGLSLQVAAVNFVLCLPHGSTSLKVLIKWHVTVSWAIILTKIEVFFSIEIINM